MECFGGTRDFRDLGIIESRMEFFAALVTLRDLLRSMGIIVFSKVIRFSLVISLRYRLSWS